MATIKLKRGTSAPTTSNIVDGEVAIDKTTQKLYLRDGSTIKEIGTGITGDATFAGKITLGDGHTISNSVSDNLVLTSSAGENLILDSGNSIYLDHDSGSTDSIYLRNGGTTYAYFRNSSDDLLIGPSGDDHVIFFQGTTGGSAFNMLKLDASASGDATFSGHIELADSKYLKLGADADFIIYHDGTSNYVQAAKQDSDIIFRGNDGGTGTNMLTLDTSAAGEATFNAGATFGDTVQFNKLVTGGFGAQTTSGTLDFDHLTNSRPGMGYTLLQGGDTNGPELEDGLASSGNGAYYYTMNYEYSTKDGSGSITQIAIPYARSTNSNVSYNKSALSMRTRYSGTWSSWARYLYLDVATGTAQVDGNLGIESNGTVSLGSTDVALQVGSSSHSTPTIQIRSGTSGTGKLWFGDNSGTDAGRYDGYIQYYHGDGTSGTREMRFGTEGTLALTLDSSQDATFAGNVNATGDVQATGQLRVRNSTTSNTLGVFRAMSDRYADLALVDDEGSVLIRNDEGNLSLRTGGDAHSESASGAGVALTLSTSQNATFAGSATATALTISTSAGKLAFAGDAGNYYIHQKDSTDGILLSGYYGVSLGHQGSKKLQVDSAGVDITGDVTVSGGILTLGTADSSSAHINSYELMTFNIDSDNDDTDRYFKWLKNGNSGSGTELMRLDESGNVTFAGDVSIPVGNKLYLGGGSHTYISEDIDDRVRFFAGGTEFLRFTEDSSDITNLYTDLNIAGGLEIAHSSDNGFLVTATDTAGNTPFAAMRLDYNASGSDTLTADRAHIGLEIDVDSSASGGDTSNEHRLYGVWNHTKATGDSDLVYGGYFMAETEQSAGTVTSVYGLYGRAESDVTGGGTNNAYGVLGYATIKNDAGTSASNAYGVYGKTLLQAANVADVAQLIGGYFEVELSDPGSGDAEINTIYAVRAEIDNNDTGTVHLDIDNTESYLYYGNYAGTQPGNAYGVYIVDDVPSYFGGSVTVHGENISMDSSSSGQLKIEGTGYTGAIALDGTAMHIYHNSSSRNLVLGSNESAGITINGSNQTNFHNTVTLGDSIGTITWGSMGGGTGFGMRSGSSRALSLGSNGNWDYLVIDTSANVGIGVASDIASKLHVKTGGATELTVEGDSTGYINAGLVLKANNSTSYRGLGVFMHDAGAEVEWYAGTPYAAADTYIIARKASLASHDNSMAQNVNQFVSVNASGTLTAHTGYLQVGGTVSSYGRIEAYGSSGAYLDLSHATNHSGDYDTRLINNGTNTELTSKGGYIDINPQTGTTYLRHASGVIFESTADGFKVRDGDGADAVLTWADSSNSSLLQVVSAGNSSVREYQFEGYMHGAAFRLRGETNDDPTATHTCIWADPDSDVWLYYDGSWKFRTKDDGVYINGSITYASDRRLKKDITPISGALDAVMSLKGVNYTLIDSDTKHIGFIAQDIQSDAPSWLTERVVVEPTTDDETAKRKDLIRDDESVEMLAVNYSNMIALLTEAMKEQQTQIEALTKRIKELEDA